MQMSDRGAELEHPHGAKSPKSWILLVGTGLRAIGSPSTRMSLLRERLAKVLEKP